jgi:5-formyltetrahydrofolate cyclo-ligase
VTIRELKRTLRTEVIERIRRMDAASRQAEEQTLPGRFVSLPGFADARTVALYVSAFPEEFPTRPLIRQSLQLGKRVACPRVDRRAHALDLFEIRDPIVDLIPGHRGIPEPASHCQILDPAQVDWILVPGLAFDERGYRLGRGAGHYDRLLPRLRPEVPRWALVLEPQWVAEVPVEPHDQPLDGVADHQRMIVFPRRPQSTETFTTSA